MSPIFLNIRRGLRPLGWVTGGIGALIVAGPGLNSDGGEATVWWFCAGLGLLLAGWIVGWLGTSRP